MKLSAQNISSSSRQNSDLSRKGFTLIEILVVIAIIAGLSAIGFGMFMKMSENAKIKEATVRLEAIAAAMEARASIITSEQREKMEIPDGALYPIGNGKSTGTDVLIQFITGDFDGNGKISSNDPGHVEYGVKSLMPELVVESGGKFIKENNPDQWLIVDPWGQFIRYTYSNQGTDAEPFYSGVYHTELNGFDLESQGPNGFSGSDNNEWMARDNIILK